jgi:hypothetical protein
VFGFLSQIIPFGDSKLESSMRICGSSRRNCRGIALDLNEEVKLQYYPIGTGRVEDEAVPLSRVVDVLNQRFGTKSRSTCLETAKPRSAPATAFSMRSASRTSPPICRGSRSWWM